MSQSLASSAISKLKSLCLLLILVTLQIAMAQLMPVAVFATAVALSAVALAASLYRLSTPAQPTSSKPTNAFAEALWRCWQLGSGLLGFAVLPQVGTEPQGDMLSRISTTPAVLASGLAGCTPDQHPTVLLFLLCCCFFLLILLVPEKEDDLWCCDFVTCKLWCLD